jgi:hypothetical protein
MTDLSPAAQAAVNAAVEAGGGYGKATPVLRARLAAALEAVVAKTKMRQYGTCWICDANELLAIAAELRGDTTTTETIS